MNFDVAQLLQEEVGATRSYSIHDFLPHSSNQVVKGGIHLSRTNRSIWVDAQLESWVDISCSRCLQEYQKRIVFSLQEEYLPTTQNSTTNERPETQTEDGTFTINSNHLLSLEEAIRQYIITCSPMKPLCREDCPGLCITCGTNLTQNQCACSTNGHDSYWIRLISQVMED